MRILSCGVLLLLLLTSVVQPASAGAQLWREGEQQFEDYRQRLTLGMQQIEASQKLSKEEQAVTPNHDAIVELNRTIGELKGKRAILGHQSRDQIWNILTPEQREKVREMQAEIDSMHADEDEDASMPRGRRLPGIRNR